MLSHADFLFLRSAQRIQDGTAVGIVRAGQLQHRHRFEVESAGAEPAALAVAVFVVHAAVDDGFGKVSQHSGVAFEPYQCQSALQDVLASAHSIGAKFQDLKLRWVATMQAPNEKSKEAL